MTIYATLAEQARAAEDAAIAIDPLAEPNCFTTASFRHSVREMLGQTRRSDAGG